MRCTCGGNGFEIKNKKMKISDSKSDEVKIFNIKSDALYKL